MSPEDEMRIPDTMPSKSIERMAATLKRLGAIPAQKRDGVPVYPLFRIVNGAPVALKSIRELT